MWPLPIRSRSKKSTGKNSPRSALDSTRSRSRVSLLCARLSERITSSLSSLNLVTNSFPRGIEKQNPCTSRRVSSPRRISSPAASAALRGASARRRWSTGSSAAAKSIDSMLRWRPAGVARTF
eukprot:Amastigsp_a340144_26.p3 type:complete len:123 gc:universal Amastigsp_a340144_26:382-750(+)